MDNHVLVRRDGPADFDVIRAVNHEAFGHPDEAALVDELRREGAVLASFVAERDGRVVGHVLFSRMLIETTTDSLPSVALAPLAVLPAYQRQGIGSQLVRIGLDWLRNRGERSVCVLGEPRFYTRFGFSNERTKGLTTPFPSAAFMALEFVENALDNVSGTVRYPQAFGL